MFPALFKIKMSSTVGEKQGWISFPLPRRIAKLDKPPPLRKTTVKRDDDIAAVPSKEVDKIDLKDDSSSVTKISLIQEVVAKGNEVSQETITRDVETSVKKRRLSKGVKLEKPPPLKTFINDENKDAVKETTRPPTLSPASMAERLINIVKQENDSQANKVPVSKQDITKPESHDNQESSHPRYQSLMSADSGFGDDSSFPSLSRQSSNLSSVGENGDLFSFELHDQEKEVQNWDNQDEAVKSFVIGPKRFAVDQLQSFNRRVYVPYTAEDVNNAKRNMLHQGQRMKASNCTQLRNAVNDTQVNKGPINSIERWETKLNSSSKSTTDKYSDISTTNSRSGNQYTEANTHSQLHSSANNITNTKVIKAFHGSENWEFNLKSMSQPKSYVPLSKFGKNISENENWEMDLIDVNNNGFYPKIEYSTLDKSIPNIYQKNKLRIPFAKMDWENDIYDSDTSPESDDETLFHVQKMSFDMNENGGCPETTSKYDTDWFICVGDQSTLQANSVITIVREMDLEALEIDSSLVYQESYRSAESSYETASSCSVITDADGVLSCNTDEPLNETEYEWELIEDLSDRMQNISIHSPSERSPSFANLSSESQDNSLDKQIIFENVKNSTLPNFDKNIYLPDDKEHACELIDKTIIAQHFNKSNSSSDKEASFSVMKDNSRRVLEHIREPISPTSSADFIQRVERTMPGIPFAAKWRRKMFAKYMRTIDVEDILDNDVSILQYSIEQLVGYANSPSSLTIPSEWSYLTKIFPEVCLYERLDFDPEKFLENYSKGNSTDRFRYCRENIRNSQPNQYNTQDRGDRNKEWSITQPFRNGFGVPRQNSYEEFTANVHTEEKPVVTGRRGFGCRRQNSSDKLVPNICTESRHMSPPWGLPHKCPW